MGKKNKIPNELERKRNSVASAKYLKNCEVQEAEQKQFKKDMKTIRISTADKNEIGMLSSGWLDFLEKLSLQFQKTRKIGCTRADEIAKHWNNSGFKTGAGKMWNPRLVNIAKHKVGIRHGFNVVE